MSETPIPIVSTTSDLEDLEMELLLEGVYRHYRLDFRKYSPASLKRRVKDFVRKEGLSSISALLERVLHDGEWLERLVHVLSVSVSTMFRDPAFYLAFRTGVVPQLRSCPFVRIWLAGVSMGEEVYSLAILLTEEGIYDRCRIYATDMNEAVLKKAKEGIYPLDLMKAYTGNYIRAGGTQEFSHYYTAAYNSAIFKSVLRHNVTFARHNLASDASFNEFNVILCRNVMIYFNEELQAHVHGLFYKSLAMSGVLGIGATETLRFSPHETAYEEIDRAAKLYRRIA